jgi:ATP-dependent DNA helicase RecQ
MVYDLADVVLLRKMLLDSAASETHKRVEQQKLESLLGFCETHHCRRQVLLEYFGEELKEPCQNCDTCLEPVETMDGTVIAQKALSCIFRTGQRFGAAHLIDILLGKTNDRIQRLAHDKLSTFGIGTELVAKEWKAVFRQLIASGYVAVDVDGYGGYLLTKKSKPILKGEEKIFLRKDPVQQKQVFRKSDQLVDSFQDPTAQKLWSALRQLRREIALEQKLPPYIIFHDSTLREMVYKAPKTLGELSSISGVGETKLERYGTDFIDVLNTFEDYTGLSSQAIARSQKISLKPADQKELSTTAGETLAYALQGWTPQQIAVERELKEETILSHLSQAVTDSKIKLEQIIEISEEELQTIQTAFLSLPVDDSHRIKPIFEHFKEKYSYGYLKIIQAHFSVNGLLD